MKSIKFFFIVLVSILFFYCSKERKKIPSIFQQPIKTEFPSFDALINNKEITFLDLKNLNHINALALDSTSALSLIAENNKPQIFGEVWNSFMFEDKFKLHFPREGKLISFSPQGKQIDSFGREGRGPNEFHPLAQALRTRDEIAINDYPQSRITITNSKFDKSEILDYSAFLMLDFWDDKFLFLNTVNERMSSSLLVAVAHKSGNELTKKINILPHFDGTEANIRILNNASGAINNEIIAIMYNRLPYVFLYNHDFNHIGTLGLNLEILYSRPLPLSLNGWEVINPDESAPLDRYYPIISDMHLDENNTLWLGTGVLNKNSVYKIDLELGNKVAKVENVTAYKLKHFESENQEVEQKIGFRFFEVIGNHIVISSPTRGGFIKFELKEE